MARVARPAASDGAGGAGLRYLAGGVAAITLLALALTGLSLRQGRFHHEQQALVASQNLARLLGQSIEDLIAKIDVALLQVKDEAERQAERGAGRAPPLDAFVARQRQLLPELRSLRITDPQGVMVYGVDEPEAGGHRFVGDREYFARVRDGPGAALVISRPLRGRVTGEWLLVFGRRIDGPGGAFSGAVLGTIPLGYFQRLFASVSIGERGGISLRDAEMGIVARHPAPADLGAIVGNKVLSPELRRPFEAGLPAATFFTPASWDNVAKAVSYRKVGLHPLFVNVGIATEDYLAEWRSELAATLVLLALFLGAVVSFALLLRRDLLERQGRAAEVLRRTREQLGLHFQQALLAVVEWDADLRVRLWNPAAERIFGYRSEEAMGRRGAELLVPGGAAGDPDGTWARFLRQTGGPHELAAVDRSGTERLCEWFNSPVPGEGGAPGGVLSFASDVTARRGAEEALRANEKRIRDIAASLGEGVYALDEQGRVTFMNPEAERLLGWTESELRGRPFSDAVQLHGPGGGGEPLEDRPERRVMRTGERDTSREVVFARRDGTRFPAVTHTTPFLQEGRVVATVTAFADIAERKRAELEREELIAKLQKALAEIKTLHGILPICSSCKKIRDEEGAWQQLETYISLRTDTLFTHGFCKECLERLYPEFKE